MTYLHDDVVGLIPIVGTFEDIARRQPNYEWWRNLQEERGVLETDIIQPEHDEMPASVTRRVVSIIAYGIPALIVLVALALT